MTKALEMKKISSETMSNVTGGTLEETKELWKTILRNQKGIAGTLGEGITFVANKVPVAQDLSQCAIAQGCEILLHEMFGMKSNISVGWLGTGFRDTVNSYKIGNKSYTHGQVLEMVSR